MKKIYVRHGASRQIARDLNCSSAEVSYALSFTRNNMLSKLIREVAINRYGGKIVDLSA